MKIYIPGLGVRYVDEDPPVVQAVQIAPAAAVVEPSESERLANEEAIRLANATYQTQVLEFTRNPGGPSPLIDNNAPQVVIATEPTEAPVVVATEDAPDQSIQPVFYKGVEIVFDGHATEQDLLK